MVIKQLVKELTGQDAPPSWLDHWPAFKEWKETNEQRANFEQLPMDAELLYDLPDEAMKRIAQLYPAVADDNRLSLLASFWHYMIFYQPPGAGAMRPIGCSLPWLWAIRHLYGRWLSSFRGPKGRAKRTASSGSRPRS
ncbi:hypothetical protein N6H14_27415 [Paenibacillus sp. CC-CFT747]|nr:hypothetical protein N6H14_27415 [Paenibacillus sp. CC-CFT747]